MMLRCRKIRVILNGIVKASIHPSIWRGMIRDRDLFLFYTWEREREREREIDIGKCLSSQQAKIELLNVVVALRHNSTDL